MNKHFTQNQGSQFFIKTTCETNSFKQRIMFLENYCRAFKKIQTHSIVHIEFALN